MGLDVQPRYSVHRYHRIPSRCYLWQPLASRATLSLWYCSWWWPPLWSSYDAPTLRCSGILTTSSSFFCWGWLLTNHSEWGGGWQYAFLLLFLQDAVASTVQFSWSSECRQCTRPCLLQSAECCQWHHCNIHKKWKRWQHRCGLYEWYIRDLVSTSSLQSCPSSGE